MLTRFRESMTAHYAHINVAVTRNDVINLNNWHKNDPTYTFN